MIGLDNIKHHMEMELDYFKHDEPEHYEEVKADFIMVLKAIEKMLP